jgi:hypothetical protein
MVVAAAIALALTGCAKKGPPSGGPPDFTPPRVVGTSPDSGASGVARDARLSVTFSEAMEPRSTDDAVSIAPIVSIKQRRWSGRTMTLVLGEPLQAGKTYTLFLGDAAHDRHGNALVGGAAVVFSTADSFPRGRIEGKVVAKGFEPSGTYLWCYDASVKAPDSTARDFLAVGIAGAEGKFRIDGLHVPGSYRVWAFADLNTNHSFEPQSDILAPADTVFTLTPDSPVAHDLLLHVLNPRAPGRVRGAVLDTLQDSLGVLRVVASAEGDSLVRVNGPVDVKGGFDLSLKPGTWRLTAYRDHDKNNIWRPSTEPASETLTMRVEPAADITNVVLVLHRASGVP